MQGRHAGYTLIEVLVGILIFALGMMALAKLQGNLARNSGDANARTVATNIAEETIEAARTFGRIDSDGVNAAYNDIVDGTVTISRGNQNYTVTTDVTDYYYHVDTDDFSTTVRAGAHNSDFKQVDLTVTWNTTQEFQVDQTQTTSGRLGSGSIRITDVISSITSPSGGKVALGTGDDGSYAPPVDYNPGENPDIISIQLGANKFKESTTPLPDVVRTDNLVETTFDVVTYSQDDSGATFLRREEFRAISCECVLRVPDLDTDGGVRPTVWDGNEYTEPEFVSKPFGEEANNQQSVFCSICCKDHHDGGTGSEDDPNDPGSTRYNPFRDPLGYYDGDFGALEGDHKHYDRDRSGELTLAENDGDTYDEACRLVRKDGFWRVAQDMRQEGLNAFPANYLDDSSEVSVYSDYVTEVVSMYEFDTDPGNGDSPTNPYESEPPALTLPQNLSPSLVFPASIADFPTLLPTEEGNEQQQLRARGIYVDYMSDVLRARINCLDNGGNGEDCEVPDVTSALEIIPFYDVQLTWLSRWTETPTNNPVDVTNEAVATDNTHDRVTASLEAGFGYSIVNSAVHSANLGLTGTDPIDPWYAGEVRDYDLHVLALDDSVPPPLTGAITSGEIRSAVHGVRAADVEVEANGALCDRSNTGYECAIIVGAINPRLTVTNYKKGNRVLVACSDLLVTHGQGHIGGPGGANWTRFNLPFTTLLDAHIVIKENSCD
jgi:prepilin-type N-terminal cleavage/methylation domain-containing protein